MNIVVFMRPVHNPALPVVPGAASTLETLQGYQPIANPKDQLALEAALALKGSFPGEVNLTVCSAGQKAAEQILKECLFYDVKEAVLLEEPCWEPDGSVAARNMADFFQSSPFDLALFGAGDIDTGTGLAGPMFSSLTGLPYIDSVVEVEWLGRSQAEVIRREKRLQERVHIPLPAALGILRGAPLRYHSFWGKLKAQQSSVRPLTFSRSAIPPAVVRKKFTRPKPKTTAMAGSQVQVRSADRIRQAAGILAVGPASQGNTLIKGKPEETAQKAVDLLKKEKLLES